MTKTWITVEKNVFDYARAWLVCMALGLIVTAATAEPEEHEEEIVRISPSELLEFGIDVKPAEGGCWKYMWHCRERSCPIRTVSLTSYRVYPAWRARCAG